jgi:hypothetical protein
VFIEITKDILITFLSGLLFYISGRVLLSVFDKRDESYSTFFLSFVTGLTGIVVLYSMLKSGFRTVNLLILVVGVLIFILYRKKLARPKISGLFFLRHVGGLFLLSVCFVFLFNFAFESKTIQADSNYYLKIAESIKLTGQENTHQYKNLYGNQFHGIEAYHFFEMWLASFIMEFSDHFLSTLVIFRIVAQSIIMSGVILGLLSLAETLKKRSLSVWDKLFTLFFSVFFFPDYLDLFAIRADFFHYTVESNLLIRPNFRTYWLFLIPPVLFLLRKNYRMFVLTILILPVISVTTALPVYGTLALLLIGNFKFKYLGELNTIKSIAVLFLSGLLFFLVLTIFKIKNIEPYYSFTLESILAYYKINYKAVIYLIFNVTLHAMILFLPFYFTVYILKGKLRTGFFIRNQLLVLFFLLLLACGIISFQIFTFMSNTYQFAFISYVGLALFLYTYVFYEEKTAVEFNLYKQAIPVILTIYMLFSLNKINPFKMPTIFSTLRSEFPQTGYSEEYLENINNFFSSQKNTAHGAYICDSLYYQNKSYAQRMPDIYFLPSSYYISSKCSYSYEFCLSREKDLLYKLDDGAQNQAYLKYSYTSTPFYLYAKKHPALAGNFSALRNNFLLENRIGYLLLTKNIRIDSSLSLLIKKIISDPNTGEKFLALKTSSIN